MKQGLRGVFAPVLTPFNAGLEPNNELFIAHCRWLLSQRAGLAIFGTNSEAASLSVDERIELTDALLSAGIPAARLMPGTGASSITDAVRLTRHAVRNGAAGVLVVPPFFFKQVSDDGLFAYYSELIERVADDRLALYLYHIPQMSGAPISLALIERLLGRYPKNVAGAKDSSGDWSNSKAMIEAFADEGFAVFPASESLLSKALAIGGAGCISATVNMNPAGIHALYEGWSGAQGAALQAKADGIRGIFQSTAMIPAMKRVLAECTSTAQWANVRPPLVKLGDVAAQETLRNLRHAGFELRDYPVRSLVAQEQA